MSWLLNLLYLSLILCFSPLLLWSAWRKGKYRRGVAEKLLGRAPIRQGRRPCVWLHAVSLGEVNLLAPLLAQIETRRPDWECVISTTTKTGFDQAQAKYPRHMVFHCPLDFTWSVREAVRRIRPDLFVLAELELWPNLIGAVNAQGAAIAVVNGRLSDKSRRRYGYIRPLAKRLLRRVDLIAAQNKRYADGFLALGAAPSSVQVTGSLKFDGAQTSRRNPKTKHLAKLAGLEDDHIVFLAGSTQEPEERLALDAFHRLRSTHPNLHLVIAPRHPERFEAVADLLNRRDVNWRRRSDLEKGQPPSPILLVDTIGELAAWWGVADIAFVGGSMGSRGGQNMIEPAAYGAAVAFGPNTRNFRDVVALMLDRDAAVVVSDGDELERFVRRCIEDPAFAAALGRRAQELVGEQLGAASRTMDLLETLLSTTDRSALVA